MPMLLILIAPCASPPTSDGQTSVCFWLVPPSTEDWEVLV